MSEQIPEISALDGQNSLLSGISPSTLYCELGAPESRLVVACGARKVGVSSSCTYPANRERMDAAGVKWVESLVWGVRECSVVCACARGGARGKREDLRSGGNAA